MTSQAQVDAIQKYVIAVSCHLHPERYSNELESPEERSRVAREYLKDAQARMVEVFTVFENTSDGIVYALVPLTNVPRKKQEAPSTRPRKAAQRNIEREN